MKKIVLSVFTMLLAVLLVACGGKDYAVDGEFIAFELSDNSGVPMYTWVTVTIEKGKVTSYYIDARQATVSQEGNDNKGELIWNDKTKKELKFDYNMKGVSKIEKEWFEQAEALEDFFLKEGPDALTVNDKGYIDNVIGVSVKDGGYSKLAKEALENAKNNKFVAFEHGYTSAKGPQFTWVEVTTDKNGKVTEIFIDCVQSTRSVDEETEKVSFAWNAKSKKELKFDYNMKGVSKIEKEWFEQAEALEAYILENGVDKVNVNSTGFIDNVTGVSIKDGGYTNVYKAALKKIA